MPQGYERPLQSTRPTPHRLRQDLGYVPMRAPPEGDGGGGVTTSGGPSGTVFSLTPIATGKVLGNLTGASAVPTAINYTFLNLTDTPSVYVGQSLKVVRVNAGETALEFAAVSGSTSIVPMVSGDTPGPGFLAGNTQFIGVIYIPLIDTRLCPTYLGSGLFAARPATPAITPGASAGYLATDTGKFFIWSGLAWVQTN